MIDWNKAVVSEDAIYAENNVSAVERKEDDVFYDMNRMVEAINAERKKHDGTLTKEDLDVVIARLRWAIDAHWMCKEKKRRLKLRTFKGRVEILRRKLAAMIEP